MFRRLQGIYQSILRLIYPNPIISNNTTSPQSTMPNITDSKCILVIGATSGLGKALALSILDLPAQPTVIVAGRRQARLDEITQEHAASGRLQSIRMDIDTDRASLKTTVEEVLAKYPKVCSAIYSKKLPC